METVTENFWTKSKILIKAVIIGGLSIVLLIPTFFVKELIEERELRQKDAIQEVSSKWAGRQNLTGPIIVLPYVENNVDTSGKKFTIRHQAYFLPDEFTVNSKIIPQERSRGIYKVMLYTSQNVITGRFDKVNLDALKIGAENILWNEASLRFNISDPKGLNDELQLKWNDSVLVLSPQSSEEGLTAPVNFSGVEDLKDIRFSTQINLNGSEKMLFSPIGKTTTVNITSPYPHPSFTGNVLPQLTSVKDSGFTASWKSMSHNRTFPQQWKDQSYSLVTPETIVTHTNRYRDVVLSDVQPDNSSVHKIGAAAFGVDLFIPVNDYQKTLRSVKYAVLCIMLTFCAFFLIETVNRKAVHPFQYGLVGLALILFYTLLLSFSEYIGFNPAYILASVCTIGLIGWFVKGVLHSGRLSMLLSMILVLLYSYVFTILQLQDYALLLGSIGLFITLGAAWNGTYNKIKRPSVSYSQPGNPVSVQIEAGGIGPFAGGYGFGARSTLLGYFVRFDAGWQMDGFFQGKPQLYLALGLDF
jgi:inner membrane protein